MPASRLTAWLRRDGTAATRHSRGTAAIEFALCLPLLCLLLIGGMEYGRAFYLHHTMVKAIRDATRYLARTPGLTVGAVDTATNQFGINAKNLALRGSIDTSLPPLIVNPDGSGTPVAAVTFTVSNAASNSPPFSGPTLIVTGILTCPFNSPLMSAFGLNGAFALTLAHNERGIGGGA